MKTFRDYLIEETTRGTYSSLRLSERSQHKLYTWLEKNDIPHSLEAKEYHCTVVYSRKAVPELSNKDVDTPIAASASGWKILGKDECLVILLDSAKIEDLFDVATKLGAESDYDEYMPHLTVSANFTGKLPKDLPPFKLIFDEYVVEELDTEFSYSAGD